MEHELALVKPVVSLWLRNRKAFYVFRMKLFNHQQAKFESHAEYFTKNSQK